MATIDTRMDRGRPVNPRKVGMPSALSLEGALEKPMFVAVEALPRLCGKAQAWCILWIYMSGYEESGVDGEMVETSETEGAPARIVIRLCGSCIDMQHLRTYRNRRRAIFGEARERAPKTASRR